MSRNLPGLNKGTLERYLGDGVYAEIEGDMVKLTTRESGPKATNTIYLEITVLVELMRYIKSNQGLLYYQVRVNEEAQ